MSDQRLTKKLMKELQIIYLQEKFFDDGLATVEFNRKDVSKLKIILLPKAGYFRNSLCLFELDVGKDYPDKKPTVNALNKLYHPNISTSKRVCFSLFGNHWSSGKRLIEYINGLLFFLAQPNQSDPYNSNCVQKDSTQYDNIVQRACKGELSGYDKTTVDGFEIRDSQELRRKYKEVMKRNGLVER